MTKVDRPLTPQHQNTTLEQPKSEVLQKPITQEPYGREMATQLFLYGGGAVALIFGSRAVMATTSRALAMRTFLAVGAVQTALVGGFVCHDVETHDIKSFSKNVGKHFYPILDETYENIPSFSDVTASVTGVFNSVWNSIPKFPPFEG